MGEGACADWLVTIWVPGTTRPRPPVVLSLARSAVGLSCCTTKPSAVAKGFASMYGGDGAMSRAFQDARKEVIVDNGARRRRMASP